MAEPALLLSKLGVEHDTNSRIRLKTKAVVSSDRIWDSTPTVHGRYFQWLILPSKSSIRFKSGQQIDARSHHLGIANTHSEARRGVLCRTWI
jgi:hypothetical protein